MEKADGSTRFCVDYRKLNAVTVRDSYPLPRMDECIDSLGDAKIFTTIDCVSGFWQVPIKKENQDKTTFVCHHGAFKFVRMPFGLTNAPASFQRALDIILVAHKWQRCLIYIDDIIIFSKTHEEHFEDVEKVLAALHEANVSIKLRKCDFFTKTVKYLGHIVEPGKLKADLEAPGQQALKKALPPTTKTQLRSFLGLANVYRRFVRRYTEIAHPLNQFLRKEVPDEFELDEPALEAFETLKKTLISPEVLSLPVRGRE